MQITRRQFLTAVVVTASSIPLSRLAFAHDSKRTQLSDEYFPQSVASGDPKPRSVVLWTRVADPQRQRDNIPLVVEVADDRKFRKIVLHEIVVARAEFDGCVRVKVRGLKPGCHYYYRFLYLCNKGRLSSRIGRTKTAPTEHDKRPIRFAWANCQDFVGRYYNAYLPLLTDDYADLDFIVQLGDYIYESNADPSYQTPTPKRSIEFDDATGAIALGNPSAPFYAAASLDNYRQLYRTYRSDPVLRRIQERFPLIAIWDDHEFADDHWQDHANDFNGRHGDEKSTARRRNAEQAWFEYMPIDDAVDSSPLWRQRNALGLTPDSERLYPNTKVYRDFRFGRHLHLSILDSRTYRPDHLIPEDAFPGQIVLDETTLRGVFGAAFDAVKTSFSPYQDFSALDVSVQGVLTAILKSLYLAEGLSDVDAQIRVAETWQGSVDLVYVNLLLSGAGQPPLDITDPTLPRGISYLLIGKQGLFSGIGSRALTVQATYDLYAQLLSSSAAEDVLGSTQQAALQDRLTSTTATWKVIASPQSFTSTVLDFTQDPDTVPISEAARQALRVIQTVPQLQPFANRFYLGLDQWDGFPHKRFELLEFLRRYVPNSLLLAGDIHAAFATDHSTASGALWEFTGPAVSSSTLQFGVMAGARALGLDAVPGIEELIAGLDALLDPRNSRNPLVTQNRFFTRTGVNGVAVARIEENAVDVSYLLIPTELVLSSFYKNPGSLEPFVDIQNFRVDRSGTLNAAIASEPEPSAQ